MKNTPITYTEINGIYYPDLTLPKQTDYPIGKYGRMRLEFLQKHRKGTYTMLLMKGDLNAYLANVNEAAFDMIEALNKQYADRLGLDETFKAEDQLRWVREMNNRKTRAEEIVLQALIYN